ncbi:MAG: pectate lyase precursor, partial [Myxococcales bacterium]|nr:pectate lyase precursor [Myxococcales bacterium]
MRAFPGAQGFGALATGGRGGRVVKVTTLNASGPGSFGAAIDLDEPRIIVFEVSGAIEADFEIPYGDVTIAGQTAPGGGITIQGRLFGAYPEGEHNYGLINGPDGQRVSLHHNLFAHHKNRSPAIANGPAEIRNNIMFNVRHGFIHHNPASG